MPLRNFHGNTFVAFVDISGFKELMKDGNKALSAIDCLYSSGYWILREAKDVQGQFVSDCGILIANNKGSLSQSLVSLLRVTRKLNQEMLHRSFMLTTSIAYGQFVYHERIEFEGIGKTPIYGNAYVSAFLDNENGRPKIQPGQCRIIKQGLPDNVVDILQNQLNGELTFIREEKRHFYYYWNVNHPEEIDNFLARYKDTYQLKYTGMLESLRGINRQIN